MLKYFMLPTLLLFVIESAYGVIFEINVLVVS